MTRAELETWLCGPDERILSHAELAGLLGLPLDIAADTTLLRTAERLRAVRFAAAVLRDVYPDDGDVRWWVRTPRPELGGRSPLDLLFAGRTQPVDELVVREWHRPAPARVLDDVRLCATA